MSVMSTGAYPRLLEEGLRKVFLDNLKEHAAEYTEIFETVKSDRNFEIDQQIDGFGYATIKNEGAAYENDTASQGFQPKYRHNVYSKGFIITREMMDDQMYDLSAKHAEALSQSMRKTREQVCANVLNRASNDNYVMDGGDGVGLLSAAHILGPNNSDTYSNELSTPANLSETALEDILIQISQAVDARGLPAMLKANKLVVPPALAYEAERLLKTSLQTGTANNDINAIKSKSAIPGHYCVNHYLTSNTAWFITTDCKDGLIYMDRSPIEFDKDRDFVTDNMRFKGYMRFSAGWTNPRGLYGSVGV